MGRGGGAALCREEPAWAHRRVIFFSRFLGENQGPPRWCQQLRHTRWKGKDPVSLLEKRFSASIYRESFWFPSARVGSHLGRAVHGWDGAYNVHLPGALARDQNYFSRSSSRTL